jgi:hypothetical protein
MSAGFFVTTRSSPWTVARTGPLERWADFNPAGRAVPVGRFADGSISGGAAGIAG